MVIENSRPVAVVEAGVRRVRFDEGRNEIRSYVVPEPVKHKKSWKLKGLKVLSTNAGGGVRVEEREVGALPRFRPP